MSTTSMAAGMVALTTAGLMSIGIMTVGSGPAVAGLGGEAAALVNARANARAGGPTSERDAELLTRYGCLSGTNSDFCSRLEGKPPRSHRRRHRQHDDD